MKRKCAEAALKFIKDKTVIGLGCGRTVAILVSLIAKAGLSVQVVTPSALTASLCLENKLSVLPTWTMDEIDIAFDGCDEVDAALNALKSSGGIHTSEKIIASMAKDYVLMVDESKLFDILPFAHPVVLEVIPESKSLVEKRVYTLGGDPAYRSGGSKDGFIVSDHGNYLLDAQFAPPDDLATFEAALRRIPGVVDTSLFYRVATRVLVAGSSGVSQLTRKVGR